ncbi:MAG: acyl-CoA thioesterase [Gammaproteobacteria bacterium]
MQQSPTEVSFPSDRQPVVRILAMPADTNPSGHIFGGWIMSQMDIAGGIVAAGRANGRVATVAVTSMEFHKPVFVGDLVSCFAEIVKTGNTSITVQIDVFAQRWHKNILHTVKVTQAVIVYVALDHEGQPRALSTRLPE